MGVLPIRFPDSGSSPEGHGAGDAEVEEQFAEDRLIVHVRIEKTRNDELSGQVHPGGAVRNRGRAPAEGRDPVPFNHDHAVWNGGSRDNVDDCRTRENRAASGRGK